MDKYLIKQHMNKILNEVYIQVVLNGIKYYGIKRFGIKYYFIFVY